MQSKYLLSTFCYGWLISSSVCFALDLFYARNDKREEEENQEQVSKLS